MIVDTSAVLAVLFDEPDAERFTRAIAEAPHCRMSVANFLEAALVVEGRAGMAGGHELDLFIEKAAIELVSVSPWSICRLRAGRGVGSARAIIPRD